jgi:hypothetical protein
VPLSWWRRRDFGREAAFFRGGYGRSAPGSLVAVPKHDIIEQVRSAGLARRALDELARTLDVEAFAAGAVQDKVVLLASADPAQPQYARSRVGDRTPLVAPVWSVFVAWENPSVAGRWLSGSAFAGRSRRPAEVLDRVRIAAGRWRSAIPPTIGSSPPSVRPPAGEGSRRSSNRSTRSWPRSPGSASTPISARSRLRSAAA